MTETDEVAHVFDVATQFTTEDITLIAPVTDGAINQTFEVTTSAGGQFIVQGMSPIFKPSVLDNLVGVQPALQKAGVTIPDCVPALSGDLYVNNDKRWYRALTYIPGVTIHDSITPTSAKSAARLIGEFHDALVDAEVDIVEPIKHFHDTAHYMRRLEKISNQYQDTEKHRTLSIIGDEILQRYNDEKDNVGDLPIRIIHGDLKVSNIRFDEDLNAVALIDMDTLMKGTVQVEMGDALRSWCGTAGEDSANQVFDKAVFEAAMEGYKETADKISKAEIDSIPEGIRLLTLELAARFLTDAYEETYFAQSSHYSSLYEQNKTKAENQLHFLNALEKSGVIK